MSLHLIGGQFKGRRLRSPKGPHVRPTTAILRKAVFDICKDQIEGAHFLDLFAGTGAMGLEALSRGAAHATFIEHSKDALRCIQDNIASLGLKECTELLKGDVLRTLKRLKTSFQIIYIDPPYEKIPMGELLLYLDQSKLLVSGGILFLEEAHPSKENFAALAMQHLVLKNSRRFGKSMLHQFIKN
jgi:16S rRNA (guanine966-N2)-methyltransferase